MPAKDMIQRRYLQLKLNRMRRQHADDNSRMAAGYRGAIDDLKAWIAAQVTRAKRKGGVGR